MGDEIDLSGDGGVLKQIVRRAKPDAIAPSDDFPVVDVHYEGLLAEDGKVFDTTREDNLIFSFELGSGSVIRSWDIALKTMKVGEVAKLTCKPEYAYGSGGSPPDIPPDATLIFEVELVACRPRKGASVGSVSEDRARLECHSGMSKTEINLRRLLSVAPNQQNQSKLMHYVATLREQLEQLSEEKTPDGLPRVTKAKVNEYYEKIEAVASKIAAQVPETEISDETFPKDSSTSGSSPKIEDEPRSPTSPQLRRRIVSTSSKEQNVDAGPSKAVKLDTAAKEHIDKHRKLQEDLTDEMVGLARQLKERSLMISQSVENTEKILDSTEEAIEQSLASTGHANVRASKIYSESSKTSCFQWLLILAMICVFIMVVLLIRVT